MTATLPDSVKIPNGFDSLSDSKKAELIAGACKAYQDALNPHRPNSYSSVSAATFRAERFLTIAMKGQRKS